MNYKIFTPKELGDAAPKPIQLALVKEDEGVYVAAVTDTGAPISYLLLFTQQGTVYLCSNVTQILGFKQTEFGAIVLGKDIK